MNRFAMSNVALLMSYRVSQKEVDKVVNRMDITPAEDWNVRDAQEVRVAAVQMMIKNYASLAEYVADMSSYVADAVNNRAKLVCFPMYAGLLPASFLPGFKQSIESIRPSSPDELPDAARLCETLSYFSDCIYDAYIHTMSALAARHRVYIMAGSTLCFEGDALCHRSFLFDSKGELKGYQDKLSLSTLDQEMQIEPSVELKAFETPVGSIAILTGSDAEYYEAARIARNLGARILICPNAMVGEYTPVRSTLGLNMRSQENLVWGVQSVLVGDTGFGVAAEGVSCMFGPVELTRSRNGILARSSGRFESEVLCTTLSMERLAEVRSPYRMDHNIEFLEKYIDRLY